MKDTPTFEPQVPEHLLEGMTARDKYVIQQLSIMHQQGEWIIRRLAEGDQRFEKGDAERKELQEELAVVKQRTEKLEQLKERLSGKWSVVAVLLGAVAWPMAMAILVRWVEKHW